MVVGGCAIIIVLQVIELPVIEYAGGLVSQSVLVFQSVRVSQSASQSVTVSQPVSQSESQSVSA